MGVQSIAAATARILGPDIRCKMVTARNIYTPDDLGGWRHPEDIVARFTYQHPRGMRVGLVEVSHELAENQPTKEVAAFIATHIQDAIQADRVSLDAHDNEDEQ